ncbi:MAG: DidE [Tistrella sp.]|uniref:condensation domain-containing protein n=1 Tax=Tistrella sp. TaxID=2024861 RepID=UPI000C5E4D2A|nr:SDR family oxidoreductase [Tistrella sp.]MAD36186.1 DidE [Tistrella sp.]MBA75305.1 DidE [Tistrella sp.]
MIPADDHSMTNAGTAPSPTDIAIIGMACRVPGADGPEALAQLLAEGREGIADLPADDGIDDPRWVRRKGLLADPFGFDAGLFGHAPREAALIDPQARLLLELAWEALERAGQPPRATEGQGRTAVYAGAGISTYLLTHLLNNPAAADLATPFEAVLANSGDSLVTRIAYELDLRGPAVDVQTACSTSLVAVHLAVQALIAGECRMALAGGASIDLPAPAGYWYAPGMILSPDGRCRAFAADAAGTVPASGGGMVVLKRLVDALEDGDHIHAVIRGSATNNDGAARIGFTAPGVEGQAEVIAEALTLAGIAPEQIGLIEAHGTGTPIGDPIEVQALTRAFGPEVPRGQCLLGSIKSNLGHLNAAAGVVGLIKAVMAVEAGMVPPTLHADQPNPALDLAATPFRLATALSPWPAIPGPRRAGVSSFGMGGSNAHVVIEQAPPPPVRPAAPARLLCFAAATATALDRMSTAPIPATADAGFTLLAGRARLPHRRVLLWLPDGGMETIDGQAPDQPVTVALARPDAAVAAGLAALGLDLSPDGMLMLEVEGRDETALLRAVARAWTQGADIDAVRLYGPGRRRLPLPGYPFEHGHHEIPRPAAMPTAADPLALPPRLADPADWFWLPVSREIPPPSVEAEAADAAITGPVLILADALGVSAILADRLRAAGHGVTLVTPGSAFAAAGPGRFTLDPADPGQFRSLVAALQAEPRTILHAWALEGAEAPAAGVETIAAVQSRGLHALLHLLQALGSPGTGPERRLLVAADRLLPVTDNDLRPDHAPLLGAAKIVSQEYDRILCRMVDPGTAAPVRLADILLAELTEGAEAPRVTSWRGGRRFVGEEAPRRLTGDGRARFVPGGVTVITGGLGGMGLAFAEEVAELAPGGALVLIGRSVFPDPEDWEDWLVENGETGRIARSIRRLQAIIARGTRLMVATADVADAGAVEAVLAEARRRFGPITALLHTAGLADYEGVIHGRPRERTDRVMAAKLQGTLVLDQATRNDPLTLFLLCSSLGTVLYHVKFGQVGYAAANEFIDAFARARAADPARPGATVAIRWSDWRDSGMSVAALARWAERTGIDESDYISDGLTDLEGRLAMRRAAGQAAPLIGVSQHDLRMLVAQDPLRARAFLAETDRAHARPALAQDYVAPRTAAEREVARIWQRLLGIDRVGALDDFYDLGGHSLLATQVLSRITERLKVEVPLDAFLDDPTVEALAGLVDAAEAARAATATAAAGSLPAETSGDDGPIPHAGRPETGLPLSFAQARCWFLDQMEPGSAGYNMPMALEVAGPLDRAALARSIDLILARHEGLRTLCVVRDGEPRQIVVPARAGILDVRAAAEPSGMQALAEAEARRPFDLTRDIPFRAALVPVGPARHLLLVTMHHIASDGWSMGVFLDELARFYAGFAAGQVPAPAPLPVQMPDVAAWQRQRYAGGRLEALTGWWRDRLAGLPDLVLPTDRPRPPVRSDAGGLIAVPLDPAALARLRALGRAERASPFMVLLAIFRHLLGRYSGQEDFAVGTPVAARSRPELEPLIGFFANTLAIRSRIPSDASLRRAVAIVREDAGQAFARQDLPFDRLVEELGIARDPGRNPVFQVLFVLQNAGRATPRVAGLELTPLEADTATAKFDLTLSVVPAPVTEGAEAEDCKQALFEFATDLFDPAGIEMMGACFAELVMRLSVEADAPMSSIALTAAGMAAAADDDGW